MAGYEYYIRDDIAPSALGRMKLTDIRRYHVSGFVADQTKAGRGTVTVRGLVTLLGTVFASAVKDELISTNPARDVDRPRLDPDDLKPWEPEVVRVFLDRCSKHRLGALFEVAVLTGLRRGEITGLRWVDVDLVARKAVVRRNRVTVNGRVQEQKTKTKAGLRTWHCQTSLSRRCCPGSSGRPGGRGSSGGMAERGSRLHHGRRPGTRSGLHHAAIPEAPEGAWRGAIPAQLPWPEALCRVADAGLWVLTSPWCPNSSGTHRLRSPLTCTGTWSARLHQTR